MFSIRFQPEQIPLFLPAAAALWDVTAHLSCASVAVQGEGAMWFGKASVTKGGSKGAAGPGHSVFTKGKIQLHAENK